MVANVFQLVSWFPSPLALLLDMNELHGHGAHGAHGLSYNPSSQSEPRVHAAERLQQIAACVSVPEFTRADLKGVALCLLSPLPQHKMCFYSWP
jgi:hypothetical protein